MLYKRYRGAINEILSLECEEFVDQVSYAIKQKREEEVWLRWVNGYQDVSLDEFKDAIGYKEFDKKEESKPIENVICDLVKDFG